MRILGALGVAALAAAPPLSATAPPRLRDLLMRAPVVLAGRVTEVTPYDDGRVAVATIDARAVPKGTRPAGPVRVVEMRDLPSLPPLFAPGTSVLVFLEPLRTNSYLARTLPRADYVQVVGGRAGRLVAATAEEAAELTRVVERLAEASRKPQGDPAARAAADRALVFDEIAARHATLVEDGAAGLGGVERLADSLTGEEQRRLEAALERRDLPPRVRAALVRAIGTSGLRRLLPALARLPSPEPEVLEASLEAMARLGAPPTAKDLEPWLGSADPAVRAAAARALVAVESDAAVARAGELVLGDPDPAVRRATIEALGERRRGGALPVLARTFREAPDDLRQVAGRAIFQVGGPQAAETLSQLAFEAPPEAQRFAVVLLIALQGSRSDPLVQRVGATHPDAGVRRLVEQGLEVSH